MLPECRNDAECFSIPAFCTEKKMLTDLRGEPRIFHSHFKDCSDRKEPAENFFRYMSGQFGDSERKSAEPIAIHAEGGSVRSVQRTLTDAVRKEDKIKDIYRRLIVQDMGDPNGILITGESGFQKKGNDSVGVAGQYCGCLGKVGNSQVGVFSAYASPADMYFRINVYLFLRNGSAVTTPPKEKNAEFPKNRNSEQNLSRLPG